MADLKTTYKDDVLNTSKNTKRKYKMTNNSDGTVSFEDVTNYSQTGDNFNADILNGINERVNSVSQNFMTFMAPTASELGSNTSDTSDYFKKLLKWICTNYKGCTNYKFLITARPNVSGTAIIHIYSTDSVNSEGIPEYSSGLYIPTSNKAGTIQLFGTYSYEYMFKSNAPTPEFSVSGTTLNIKTT